LRHNKAVTDLYIGQNGIGDKGAKALAGAVAVNEHLEHLFLRRNRITDKGMKALLKAMDTNDNIRRMDFVPVTMSITGEGGSLDQVESDEDNEISEELLTQMHGKVKKTEAASSEGVEGMPEGAVAAADLRPQEKADEELSSFEL
jgi:Ran GTPase-activating protein (RanGAP) involved in mRNA processing and transport